MKCFRVPLLGLFLCAITLLPEGQTPTPTAAAPRGTDVPAGAIMTNTTWTKAGNPYVLTGQVVVFPDATLTIEPGVQIQGGETIEVRGGLFAIGSPTEPIICRCGIYYAHDNAGGTYDARGAVRYVRFSQGGVGVANAELTIQDSIFTGSEAIRSNPDTGSAVYVFGSSRVTFERSVIEDHWGGINGQGNSRIQVCKSVFRRNQVPVYTGGGVEGSVFYANAYGPLAGVIRHSVISGNLRPGGSSFYDSVVAGNQWGVETSQPGSNNTISNQLFDMSLSTSSTANAANNWWGTTDRSLIEARIHDGKDDPQLGLVQYEPILTQPPAFTLGDACPGPLPVPVPAFLTFGGGQLPSFGPHSLTWESLEPATQFQIQVVPYNNDGPGINLIISDRALVERKAFFARATGDRPGYVCSVAGDELHVAD